MKVVKSPWLSVLKDYWWLATVIGGALVLWGNLPMRTTKLEAGQAKQEAQVSELREWTKETQGFLKGQQALNERLAAQQQAPPIPPLPEPRTPPSGHPDTIAGGSSRASPSAEELSDDGEIKLMRWTDEQGKVRMMCCNGTDCWPWRKPHGCAD